MLYEEKVYVSSDWGPRKEGRVFVANRFDGSQLMMIEHDVDSVQGMWWSIVLEGCMSQYTRLLYWRNPSLVLF